MTDSHLHLQQFFVSEHDSESLFSEVLQRAANVGVDNYICCGTSPNDWDTVLQLATRYPDRVIPCFGLHPWAAATAPVHWEKQLEDVLRTAVPQFGGRVGVGEIGLDKNCRRRSPYSVQEVILTTQLELARQFYLPVTLHCVGASVLLTQILHHWVKTSPSPLPPLILHGFTHPYTYPYTYSKPLRIFYSISPAVLDTKHTALRRWVAELPVHQLLFESDSPNRRKFRHGHDTEPAIVATVLREVATLRHVSVESLERDCQKNVDDLFRPLS